MIIRKPSLRRVSDTTRMLALSCCMLGLPGIASAGPLGAYPSLGLMFAYNGGAAGDSITPQQAANYDQIVDAGLFSNLGDSGMAFVRQTNPNFVGLLSQQTGYVSQFSQVFSDPAFQEQYLVHYTPTDPSIPACDPSLRIPFYSAAQGPAGQVFYWNLLAPNAVAYISNYTIGQFNQFEASHPLWYDGIYLDGSNLTPQFYNSHSGIDSNCDGTADNSAQIARNKAAWQGAVVQFLQNVRTALPNSVILANGIQTTSLEEISPTLLPLLNGLNDELDLTAAFQNNLWGTYWDTNLFYPLSNWNNNPNALQPIVTTVVGLSNTSAIYSPSPGQVAQAQQNYQAVRFGLASALMTGSRFVYDYSTWYTNSPLFWYDEYDNAGTQAPGYLGSPVNAAYLADNYSTGKNLINAAGFVASTGNNPSCNKKSQTGVKGWCTSDSQGLSTIAPTCYQGSCAAKITTTATAANSSQLYQDGVALVAGHSYTLSFWAKAASPRPLTVYIMGEGSVHYASLTAHRTVDVPTKWSHFVLTFTASAITPTDPAQVRFVFQYGAGLPDLYLATPVLTDGVDLNDGVAGLYRRDFQNGTALINITGIDKTITLNQTYYHINGTQDPVVNNGQAAQVVTVGANDAVILLNNPTPTPPAGP